MSEIPTAKDVAAFMISELDRKKELYQEDVVYEIEKKFGKKFVYTNENGNPAIDRNVLKEFKTPPIIRRGEHTAISLKVMNKSRMQGKYEFPIITFQIKDY
jgi:hypothetical protein